MKKGQVMDSMFGLGGMRLRLRARLVSRLVGRDRLSVGLRYLFALPWMFVAGFGFGARRRRLLICFAGALSLSATGFVASAAARSGGAVAYAAAHPHRERRSCHGLLAVHDFPGAVSAARPYNKAHHGVYTSLCATLFPERLLRARSTSC